MPIVHNVVYRGVSVYPGKFIADVKVEESELATTTVEVYKVAIGPAGPPSANPQTPITTVTAASSGAVFELGGTRFPIEPSFLEIGSRYYTLAKLDEQIIASNIWTWGNNVSTVVISSELTYAQGMALDQAGNLYLAISNPGVILKITPIGEISTFASGFTSPIGVAVDAAGNLYVTDRGVTNRIRKITPSGVVSTLTLYYIDGSPATDELKGPVGIWLDSNGNIFVTDHWEFYGLYYVKKITVNGTISTIVNSGLSSPRGGVADSNGNIFVADTGNNRICKITPNGALSIFAGGGEAGFMDGEGVAAQMSGPMYLAIDGANNIFMTDAGAGNRRIRRVTPSGTVSTIAGNGIWGFADGAAADAQFRTLAGITLDGDGYIFVVDTGDWFNNNRIRKIS